MRYSKRQGVLIWTSKLLKTVAVVGCDSISITLGNNATQVAFHMHNNSLFSLFPAFPTMHGPVVGDRPHFVRIFEFLHCVYTRFTPRCHLLAPLSVHTDKIVK